MSTARTAPIALAAAGLLLLALGALGGWLYQSRQGAASNRAEIEQVVEAYLLEHPEILPKAMERLRAKETEKQLTSAGDKLFEAYPGAVLGNPNGTVTLVEFTDFACTFCRQSVADVEALIAANPDLKVVVRELPILSPQSAVAARWGLAAAAQGKYPAFHKAMYAAGRPDDAAIEAAARTAGLDLERARQALSDPRIEAELAANQEFARQLGVEGTPTWVAGEQLFSGAVGLEMLSKAISDARKS